MPTGLDALLYPALGGHYLYHRLRTNKYGDGAPEKLGRLPAALAPAQGKRVLWVHAVSVGETQAARQLVQAFAKAHPDWIIRVSTTTATGRAVAQKNFGAENVFYYPLDVSWMVESAFETIRPDLVVLMELEVWPQFLRIAKRRGVPVAVSNVRITEKSERNFARFGGIFPGAVREVLSGVRLWLSQSEFYRQRLLRIGVAEETIRVVGSLKYDAVPTVVDPAVRVEYRRLFGAGDEVPVFVAGSTHPGEDTIALDAFKAARETHPSLRLVLVPRHPERLNDVETMAKRYGSVVRRSSLDGTNCYADIVLVDTMGELCKMYAAAEAVFVGGSFLAAVGGHNIMEPCGLGIATLTGPENHNFAEPVDLLCGAGGLVRVNAPAELSSELVRLLSDARARGILGENARKALMAEQGAVGRSLAALEEVLTHGA